mmetsp:Transcript_76702/g.159580  ORF Transcript_76702/g.159580 Transcript_76702/m.159580 type:complete len:141 (-) Transcript_76702:7-429(-)
MVKEAQQNNISPTGLLGMLKFRSLSSFSSRGTCKEEARYFSWSDSERSPEQLTEVTWNSFEKDDDRTLDELKFDCGRDEFLAEDEGTFPGMASIRRQRRLRGASHEHDFIADPEKPFFGLKDVREKAIRRPASTASLASQ